MRDLIPEWIADLERFQEMPLEMSAELDLFLERYTIGVDIKDIRGFIADRHAVLQGKIDELRAANLSGLRVLLAEEGD